MRKIFGLVCGILLINSSLFAVEISGLLAKDLYGLMPGIEKRNSAHGQIFTRSLESIGECRQTWSVNDAYGTEAIDYSCSFLKISFSEPAAAKMYESLKKKRLSSSIRSVAHATITTIESPAIRCTEINAYGGTTSYRCVLKTL